MSCKTVVRKALITAAVTLASAWAAAAPPTFRITSLFSNLDGSVQYIRLDETAGLDGQHRFAGLTIRSIAHGVVKEFTFAADLPTEKTAYASVVVVLSGGGPILGGVAEHDGSFISTLDYFTHMPRFLAADGGVVDFAGVDQVSHPALPTDGIRGVLRDGTIAVVTYPGGVCRSSNHRCWIEASVEHTLVVASEYYNAALDRYFLTAAAPDIDALESGRHPGWKRTDFYLYVGSGDLVHTYCHDGWWYGCGQVPPLQPVCRFYLPPQHGNSHFLSAFASECASLRALFPDFVLESEAAFFVVLPDPVTGECPNTSSEHVRRPLLSVFRLWRPSDNSHRYTYNVFTSSALIDQGWVAEGYGPQGVAFCVPVPNG